MMKENQNEVAVLKEDYFYAVIKSAMNLPGVKINRASFLRTALKNHVRSDIIEKAILTNPAHAGISIETIDKIAKSSIKTETTRVTAISAASGVPGGFAIAGTLPADLVQYFAHVIRVLQKEIYLYGWKEMHNEDGTIDDETLNQLTLFLGVMFGVNAAGNVINQIVKVAGPKIEKAVAKKALMGTFYYPVIRKIARILGIRMTKQIFARGIGKAIPIVGAATSGGITYFTFKPLSSKLMKYLKDLPIADPEFYNNPENYTFKDSEIIDIDPDDYK